MMHGHDLKQQNYFRDHPDGVFPAIEALPRRTVERIRETLTSTLLPESPGNGWLGLVEAIREKAVPVQGFHAADPAFDLERCMASVGLDPGNRVIMNWYRFEELDEMAFHDLCESFAYVWYPSADDLEIIDPGLRWVLTVEHHGAIAFLRLNERLDPVHAST